MRRIQFPLLAVIAIASVAPVRADAPKAFPLFDKAVRAMSVSPDGKTLVVGGDSGEIAVWDIAGEKVLRRLKHHSEGVRAVLFSPDGSVVFSGGNDGLLCFWSTATGELQRAVKSLGAIEDASLSPDGHKLAVSFREGSEVQILSSATGKEIRRLELPFNDPLPGSSSRSVVAFSPDGSLLVASSGGRGWPKFAGGDSMISIWNVGDWTRRASFVGDRFTMCDVEFSPDGQWLAGACNRGKTVKLWGIPAPVPQGKNAEAIARWIEDLDSDEFAQRETAQRKLLEIGRAAQFALEKAAKSNSTEMKSRAAAILKQLSHEPKQVLPGSPFDTHSVAFSPNGKWLASGRQFDRPGNVILYELGEVSRRVTTPHQHGAWVLVYSADGKQLITGRRDGSITFWTITAN